MSLINMSKTFTELKFYFFVTKITILFLLIFCLSLQTNKVNAQNWGGGNRASSVNIEKPIKETLSTTKELRGKIVTTLTSEINSIKNGLVFLEDISIGDMVKSGQLIAKQDTTNLNYNLEIKQNQLKKAKLLLEEIKQELLSEKEISSIVEEQFEVLKSKYDRAKKLAKTNAISTQEYENVISSYLSFKQQVVSRKKSIDSIIFKEKQAKNNINELSIEISKLEKDISDTELRSPVNGQIIDLISIKSGYIRIGEKIAIIQNLNDFEIELDVPVKHIDLIKESANIFGLDVEGEKISASYRVTLPIENPRTGTRTVRLKINGKINESLKANNATVSLLIPTNKPTPLLTISKDALIPVSGGQVVFIFKEGKAIRKFIKLGGSVGDRVIILSGISEEDEIIVRGNELLKDGSSVKIAGQKPKKQKSKSISGEKWLLTWQSRRGEQTGTLIIGKENSTFNEEKVEVKINDNTLVFEAPIVLPFGTITLNFDGKISNNKIEGTIITKLPNGNENSGSFSGKKDNS